MKQPLMKWTGSKRPIAELIASYFPTEIEYYYEPFVGGGSVVFELLRSGKIVSKYILSDTNESLIDIYKLVQFTPTKLIEGYKLHWTNLQQNPDYYYKSRTEYNKTKCPILFFFLTRTCYNGTIRYNSKGEFNTSFHFGRKGMNPDTIQEIVIYYHKLMENKPIEFLCKSFEFITPMNQNDVVYCDPPYSNSKALYHGNIKFEVLTNWLDSLICPWFMNMNGINREDNEQAVTFQFTDKVLLKSGKSSFSKMKGKDVTVSEYFYIKN